MLYISVSALQTFCIPFAVPLQKGCSNVAAFTRKLLAGGIWAVKVKRVKLFLEVLLSDK
ncbi:MAG: hypothetical protein Q4F50_02245 [Bacteroides sp.]|uniref:hypothetical protein n=1 Tax=Bacteroides sp. TaxID=29523 RepID=UPI0026E09C63|nr:hypothetical protein [Bacteroides sp.]MDO5418873.1 hypothetical protein [Bacteroides sp.]